jgi:hypothetical protein
VSIPVSNVIFLTFFREEHGSYEGEDEQESHGTDGAGLGPNLPPSTVEFGGDAGRVQSRSFHTEAIVAATWSGDVLHKFGRRISSLSACRER